MQDQDPPRALPKFKGYDKVQRHGLRLAAFDANHVVAAAKAGQVQTGSPRRFASASPTARSSPEPSSLPAGPEGGPNRTAPRAPLFRHADLEVDGPSDRVGFDDDEAALEPGAGVDDAGRADRAGASGFVDVAGEDEVGLVALDGGSERLRADVLSAGEIAGGAERRLVGDQDRWPAFDSRRVVESLGRYSFVVFLGPLVGQVTEGETAGEADEPDAVDHASAAIEVDVDLAEVVLDRRLIAVAAHGQHGHAGVLKRFDDPAGMVRTQEVRQIPGQEHEVETGRVRQARRPLAGPVQVDDAENPKSQTGSLAIWPQNGRDRDAVSERGWEPHAPTPAVRRPCRGT